MNKSFFTIFVVRHADGGVPDYFVVSMKHLINIAGFIFFAAALFSCTQEVQLQEEHFDTVKVLGTKSCADPASLLVKLENGATGEQIMLLAPGVASVNRLFPSIPGKEELEAQFGLDRWYELSLVPGTDNGDLAQTLAASRSVASVQFNTYMEAGEELLSGPYEGPVVERADPLTKAALTSIFNDPMLADQWHYKNNGSKTICNSAYAGADINVERVWQELTTGDESIIVAVIDEGVKYIHPDLAANMWVNTKEKKDGTDTDGNGYVDDIYGYNFKDNGPITWSDEGSSGHATHIAGTIAAVNGNGKGVCGIAGGGNGLGNGCKIMSCQVFSHGSTGSSASFSRAIKYAADNGASVISCSYGIPMAIEGDAAYYKISAAEIDAIRYFEATRNNSVLDGNIAIFAAGNEGRNNCSYPGATRDFISVSAFGPDFLPTYYTNYGRGCNIVAPGGEAYLAPFTSYASMVLSTMPSELNSDTKNPEYGYMQGTSMAAPHVSGVVALALSYAKKLGKHYTVQEFKNMILASTNDFESRLSAASKDYFARAANYITVPQLGNYRGNMGTGALDAWRLMMKIEGVPCITAVAGESQWIDLSEYFGSSSVNLSYLGVDVSDADTKAIGLKSKPEIKYGRLYIYPTKNGVARFKINAVGGGTEVGTDDKTGGMAISQNVSVIVRSHKSKNGGWL